MAGRKRVGRTLRRPTRNTRATAAAAASTASASVSASALQAIRENTVVDLTESPKRAAAAPPAQTQDAKRQRALTLLRELEDQLDERCAQLMDEARKKADELQREMRVQLIMLPEPVRRMPWRVFVDQYGGDIERAMGLTPDDTESSRSATPVTATTEPEEPASTVSRAPPPTVRSKDRVASPMGRPPLTPYVSRGPAASAFETPAASSGRMPSTVMRTVRKGETLYSIRGSPVVPDAATFAPPAPTPAQAAAPFVTLENASETIAALGTTSVRLDEEARAQAKAQLKLLQEQVNALMRQLA